MILWVRGFFRSTFCCLVKLEKIFCAGVNYMHSLTHDRNVEVSLLESVAGRGIIRGFKVSLNFSC